MRLFGAYGYHGATVPMIVAESGSSTGSFYAHFHNKEDVFAAVLEELGARTVQLAHAAEHPETPEGMCSAVEALFLFLAENPVEARILIVESSGLSPRLEEIRRRLLRQHAEHVLITLRDYPDYFETENPLIAAQCLVGAVFEALVSWMELSEEERAPAAEIARIVSNYNLRAVRKN